RRLQFRRSTILAMSVCGCDNRRAFQRRNLRYSPLSGGRELMCGIVGVFLKNPANQPQLGGLLAGMLAQMTERGPDSAGFAVYGDAAPKGAYKATLFHPDPKFDWTALRGRLDEEFGLAGESIRHGSHCVVTVRAEAETLRDWLARACPEIRPMGFGERIEIFKERGLPDEVIASFGLTSMSGSHALGHTRMATESAV